MQGLFILSLLVLVGCGAANCLGYFDSGFLVLQGLFLFLAGSGGLLAGGPLRAREHIGVLVAVEWLMSYGHCGPALGVYGLSTVCLLFNRTLPFPSTVQMVLYCLLVGTMCGSPTPWVNHQQIVFGMVLGAGLLVNEQSSLRCGTVVQHLIVSGTAVLALAVLGAEYGYYYHGDSHGGLVHPHFIGSVLLCALLGFSCSWQALDYSREKIVNVVSLMVSTLLLYTVVVRYGAIWWKYAGAWWGGGQYAPSGARELVVPSGWLVEGVPYPGIILFVLLAGTITLGMIKKGKAQGEYIMQSVPLLWSCLAIGGVNPASVVYNSVADDTNGRRRSWLFGILIVVCTVSIIRLWENRPYYFHRNDGGSTLAMLTPLEKTLLAAEDIFFCQHSGVDFARLKWVVRDTLRRGSFDRGASTLTMQLVKVRHLSYDKSIFRKVLQVLIALWYEARLDKSEIITMYLNEVSFGPHITGIEQASQHYFQKKSSDLGLREIEYLVATIEDPAHFSPQQLPNVPDDVAGRLKRIRGIRAEFDPYFSRACEKS